VLQTFVPSGEANTLTKPIQRPIPSWENTQEKGSVLERDENHQNHHEKVPEGLMHKQARGAERITINPPNG